jgi:hypothetical protein
MCKHTHTHTHTHTHKAPGGYSLILDMPKSCAVLQSQCVLLFSRLLLQNILSYTVLSNLPGRLQPAHLIAPVKAWKFDDKVKTENFFLMYYGDQLSRKQLKTMDEMFPSSFKMSI